MLPTSPGGIPWRDGFDLNLVTYTPLTIGTAFLLAIRFLNEAPSRAA